MVADDTALLGQQQMKISLELAATTPSTDVVIEIAAAGNVIHRGNLTQNLVLDFDLPDHDQLTDQQIQINFNGKTHRHTVVDHTGVIVSDVAVEVKEFKIEDISVRDIFCLGKKCYHHNHNGSTNWIVDEFYGYMGFNGTVTFDFYSPVYLWIGEQFP
jgi:hypothetical protein